MDYRSRQGVECQQSLIPALITTGSYGKERKKRGVPIEQETEGYCVQFQLGPIPSCRQVRAPHAQWTRYLTQSHTVCVRCEWPAQNARSRRCYGDGGQREPAVAVASGRPPLLPRDLGEAQAAPRLPAPAVHSLVFI
ncbi:Somatomedin-B and thrombospondin type-1 domain-containing protein [Vulpes lagopus]